MGNESTEYLPLVSDTCPPEEGLGAHRGRSLRQLREILLVLVILLQTAILVLAFTWRSHANVACQCPHREPLLYCTCLVLELLLGRLIMQSSSC